MRLPDRRHWLVTSLLCATSACGDTGLHVRMPDAAPEVTLDAAHRPLEDAWVLRDATRPADARPRPDAGPRTLDARPPAPDALDPDVDGAGDARTPPVPDATTPSDGPAPRADADTPPPDADAPPPADALGPPLPDAATPPTPDAAGPAPDGALPRPDAAPPTPDAAPLAPDAAPLLPDLGPRDWHLPARPVCNGVYGAPQNAAIVGDPALVESSGIVASPTTPGLLWLHNDSGDRARIFAVRTDGARVGRVTLRGAAAHDYEDIGAAPCPDGSGPCLWVADIGNNNHNRNDLAVYVFPEPVVDPNVPFADMETAPVARYRFHYPMAAAPDAEALFVAPDGSTFYILEKIDWDRARAWKHPGPLVPDVDTALVSLPAFATPGVNRPSGREITGGSMHPSGRRVLVRTYSGVYEYRFDAGGGLEDLDAAERVQVALGPDSEPQGEAVTYDETGTGLYTISEGAARALHHYDCLPAP